MTTGVLATVTVRNPEACPVASLSDGGHIQSVSQGQPSDGSIPVEVTASEEMPNDDGIAEQVFSYESETVYRLERDVGQGCACERVELHGCPVRNVTARDGKLVLTFIAPDLEMLRTVIDTLRDGAATVSIKCLRRSGNEDEAEPVFVDKSAFTPRQREVLQRAHEMGYFAHPKHANAGEVAADLGIAASTLAEILSAAQTKLMDAIFTETTMEH